jgi:two-component system, sensor histidine kinase and response regulator
MKPLDMPPVKFLLVDDREENLIALEALLRRDGLEILKASNGDAALELLLEHDFALAFLDVQMPDMDGFALAELMRGSERTRHVPIIFVTAAVQEQRRVFRGYDAGAVDFLFKPIEPHVLNHKAATFFDLYRQRQRLAANLRLTETFMAALGHDLRTPLNSIVVGAELLLRAPLDAATRAHAERVRTSGRRMAAMIADLHDLARVRLGDGMRLERERVDLAAVVDNVVAECRATFPGRTVTVSVEGTTEGEWDKVRLAQVLSNLVTNALRHGDAGGRVLVGITGTDDEVCIAVHNDGVIAPDVRDSLFDPFRQGAGRPLGSDGLGLGLFIVEQLVSAHRGRVVVESADGVGTTFSVQLPRAPSGKT